METGPLPDWFEALKIQFADNNRVPPVTPDYSTMNPRMSPTEWNNFTHFASRPPGVTLNRSGGARFSYLPSDLPPNTEPWFRADYGGGFNPSVRTQSSGFSTETPFNSLPRADAPPAGAGNPNFPPTQEAPMPSSPGVGSSIMNALVQRAGAMGGPLGLGLTMAMRPTPTAPRSMDEAPQWSWPTGGYSP